MDDRVWRNISIGLGVICALLIGVAGALMIVGGRSDSSAGPSETPIVAEATPTTAALPSGSGTVATPAPTPTPSPGPSLPATIVFNGLGLDAANDTAGTLRTFTFQSDGAGALNVSVTKTSAGGTSKMCIKVDAGAFACKVGSLPGFPKASSDTAHSTWTVTLQGYGASKPTVDLSITWPTSSPKVTISHGRFQGSSTTGVSEGLNGFTATFQPRTGGSMNVQASWTGVAANAELILTDVTSTPTVKLDDRNYSGATYVNPSFSFTVDSTKSYQVKLRDTSADSGRPDLTAQISFP
jgi:hypothetical protein